MQVLELRSACLEHLLVNVLASNIVEYMISADACNEQGLIHACCAYAKNNRCDIVPMCFMLCLVVSASAV